MDSDCQSIKSTGLSILHSLLLFVLVSVAFANGHDGDINLDLNVNTVDVLWGYQSLLGLRSLTPTQELHGDVAPIVSGVATPNGIFDLGDVLVIQNKVLGIADFAYCGDGVVQAGEQCDDGNTVDGDYCNNSCQYNGVIVPQTAIELFDGTLDKLYPWFSDSGFSDPNGIFSIENDVLHVSGGSWGALYSSDLYRDYVMVLEFRWGTHTYGQREGLAKDAGVLIHSNGDEGDWNGLLMPGLQVQIIDGSLGDFILAEGDQELVTMTVATEQVSCIFNNWNCRGGYRWHDNGTELTFDQNNASVHWASWDPGWIDVAGFRGQTVVESDDGDWNQLVVVADGPGVDVYLNGVMVNSALAVSPDEGQIQLEVEFAEYFVRRWELHPLGYEPNPVIISHDQPTGVVGVAYSGAVEAAGVFAPVAWAKTAGSLPPGLSLNPDNGEIEGSPTTPGQYGFTVQVTDSNGGSAQQDFSITIVSGNLVTAGLVMQLESTQGVVQSGGSVTQWQDQSGTGGDLAAAGSPQLVAAATPSAQPAISLDGVDDQLHHSYAPGESSGLPVGATDRTMFVVTRYHSASASGGVAYGNGASNQAFGPVVRDTSGVLAVMGWGTGNDLDSQTVGLGAGWLIQSVVLHDGTAELFKDGISIARWDHSYNTVLDSFVIAAEIAGFGYQAMDVAAVLVYDRALDDLERAQVGAYLQNKYLDISP